MALTGLASTCCLERMSQTRTDESRPPVQRTSSVGCSEQQYTRKWLKARPEYDLDWLICSLTGLFVP